MHITLGKTDGCKEMIAKLEAAESQVAAESQLEVGEALGQIVNTAPPVETDSSQRLASVEVQAAESQVIIVFLFQVLTKLLGCFAGIIIVQARR